MVAGFVVATTQRRQARWEGVLGTALIPVLDIRPRWMEFRGGSELGFDLAVCRLHEGQINRLAAYLARKNRLGYRDSRSLLLTCGMAIRASDVMVVDEKTADADVGRLRLWMPHGATRWPFLPSC